MTDSLTGEAHHIPLKGGGEKSVGLYVNWEESKKRRRVRERQKESYSATQKKTGGKGIRRTGSARDRPGAEGALAYKEKSQKAG